MERKKGSITVFLSLILVLLFSFLMTMIEGARIRGASAYVAMLSELAGDSFLASYYYPLFQEYRLFGVDAGTESGYFSESTLGEKLQTNIEYGISGLKGGLFSFEEPEVGVTDYKTIMSEDGAAFIKQIREQMVLDGLSLAVTELFTEEQFEEAGAVGQIVQQQQKALEKTSTVTKELLQLMELTDGITAGSQGLKVDRNGKLKVENAFIKQLVPMSQEELRRAFENEEVYRATIGNYFRADEAAEQILLLIEEVEKLESRIAELQEKIYEEEQKDWKEQDIWQINEWKFDRNAYEDQRENAIKDIQQRYQILKDKLADVIPILEKTLSVLEKLREKQEESQEAVTSYEAFLNGMQASVSSEMYSVFAEELETMKLYAGMEEQGYYIPTMRKSVEQNLALLKEFSLENFLGKDVWRIKEKMEQILTGMDSYTTEGLWFTYGKIIVAEETGADILGAVGNLMATGLLELVGISEEAQSKCSLDGEALPSAALEGETTATDLIECIGEVGQLFSSGGIREVLEAAGNAALDTVALELYGIKYFHSFINPSRVTRLQYEREYLLFGAKKDKTNLFSMVLYLISIRTIFSLVSILKQPDKMAEIEALAAGIAGCTGIPMLLVIIKYAVVLLWAAEEALIEVAALLQGKRVALVGTGSLSISDLLLVNKSMFAEKAASLPEGAGPDYEDYLVLLSLTKTAKKKMYRLMDLIQENIRYRYRDSFRMRNLVTELEFCTETELKRLYDTKLLQQENYYMKWKEKCAY